MSTITIQKIQCINVDCKNDLTDFELTRLTRYFNKYRFCRYCRGHIHRISDTVCDDCGIHLHNNTSKLYCTKCVSDRRIKKAFSKYHSTKRLRGRGKKTIRVLEYLRTHDIVTCNDLAADLGMSPGAIRTCIYNLRKYRHIKISVGYTLG